MNYIYMLGFIYPRLTIEFFSMKISILFLIVGIINIIYRKFKLNKRLYILLGIELLVFLSMIITSLYNGVFDKFIITYLVLQLMWLGYIFILENKNISLDRFIRFYISVMTIQGIFGILFYLRPEIGIKINNYIYFDSLQKEFIKGLIGLRFVGIATAFFGAGIEYGIGLIFLVYLYFKKNNKKIKWLYIFNLIVGILYARTTLVGMSCSILLFLLLSKNISKVKMLKILCESIFILCILILFLIFLSQNNQNIKKLFNWGFEIILNFMSSGHFKSKSFNGMLKFYKIIPDNLKTWIIGDGYWHWKGGYYKHIDIGYLRMLFYTGIQGTFIWILSKFLIFIYIIKIKKNKKIKNLSLCILLFDLILNIKGYTSLNYIQYLLLVLNQEYDKRIIKSVKKS